MKGGVTSRCGQLKVFIAERDYQGTKLQRQSSRLYITSPLRKPSCAKVSASDALVTVVEACLS